MGNLAKTIFSILLGWFPSVAYAVWSGLNHPDGSFFAWIGHHLLIIFIILCVIGVTADTVVYCFRWKPITVWKSFFRKRKRRSAEYAPTGEGEYFAEDDPVYYESDRFPVFSANYAETPVRNPGEAETGRYETAPAEAGGIKYPGKDGYTETVKRVSDDTVYRRPERVPSPEGKPYGEDTDRTQPRNETAMGPRRRRILIQQLFGETDEEKPYYHPPKPVIDQRDAYHQAVYPRNWKGNNDGTK